MKVSDREFLAIPFSPGRPPLRRATSQVVPLGVPFRKHPSRARADVRTSEMGRLGNARATCEVALRTRGRVSANGGMFLRKLDRRPTFKGLAWESDVIRPLLPSGHWSPKAATGAAAVNPGASSFPTVTSPCPTPRGVADGRTGISVPRNHPTRAAQAEKSSVHPFVRNRQWKLGNLRTAPSVDLPGLPKAEWRDFMMEFENGKSGQVDLAGLRLVAQEPMRGGESGRNKNPRRRDSTGKPVHPSVRPGSSIRLARRGRVDRNLGSAESPQLARRKRKSRPSIRSSGFVDAAGASRTSGQESRFGGISPTRAAQAEKSSIHPSVRPGSSMGLVRRVRVDRNLGLAESPQLAQRKRKTRPSIRSSGFVDAPWVNPPSPADKV
jgi:hypothetical protein